MTIQGSTESHQTQQGTDLMSLMYEPSSPLVKDTLARPADDIASVADLATRMLAHLVEAANAAGLDTNFAATFMAAELLAALKVHANVEPEDLIRQFRHLVDRRSAQMLAEKTNTPGP